MEVYVRVVFLALRSTTVLIVIVLALLVHKRWWFGFFIIFSSLGQVVRPKTRFLFVSEGTLTLTAYSSCRHYWVATVSVFAFKFICQNWPLSECVHQNKQWTNHSLLSYLTSRWTNHSFAFLSNDSVNQSQSPTHEYWLYGWVGNSQPQTHSYTYNYGLLFWFIRAH